MNSSMLTGERRWTSGKRGGMTVLGKVAVPKPLNLPSQRLENHGLDPNVEIVPKGTLSWGARPTGSNPWISSSLSPNADGSAGSPHHLSGRPSSGGSVNRPSTSGSDKTQETGANTWASNSRPTSSSGALPSNHIPSAALRPRSAENRPTSSPLSRFAEPVSENSMAWISSTAAGKMGVKTANEHGFTLSSGDFPNLGSEKDYLEKHIESTDHGRPRSASRGMARAKEEDAIQADVKIGTVNTWSLDGFSRSEDDEPPDTWKRQGNPQQYFNANASGQVFDVRHDPHMNGPPVVWYEGHPRGPAAGASNAQGGFPPEAYPYYHPQIRPPPLLGPQPVPPGAGPRGPHPKGGDLFRPPLNDGYAHPNMPFRPGFYSVPPGPIPFEGHYRRPMGYFNNDRGNPYMGIAARGPVYNGFGTSGAEIGGSHGRPSGYAGNVKAPPEHMEPNYAVKNQSLSRGPVRNQHEFDQSEGANQSHNSQYNVPNPGRDRPSRSFRTNEWGAEEEDDMFAHVTKPDEDIDHNYAAVTEKKKFQDGAPTVKTVLDDNSERVSTISSAIPQKSFARQSDTFLGAGAKGPALIQKIDCLNAKRRVSEGRSDSTGAHKEEERNTSQLAEGLHCSIDNSPVNHGVKYPNDTRTAQPTAVLSRRAYYGGPIGVDHQNTKPLSNESLTAKKMDSASGAHPYGPPNVGEDDGNWSINSSGNDGDFVEASDSTDIQAQKAKMRELAKQRATQMQKQEEERMREQKAKALAKLEELNRRTLASDSAYQKVEPSQSSDGNKVEKEIFNEIGELVNIDARFPQPPGSNQTLNLDAENPAEERVKLVKILSVNVQKTGPARPVVSSSPMPVDVHDGSSIQGASRSTEMSISKHQRQMEKKFFLKGSNGNAATADADRDCNSAAVTFDASSSQENVSNEGKPPSGAANVTEISKTPAASSAHPRRKNNRSSKNKHMPIEVPPVTEEDSIVNPELKNSVTDSESRVLTLNSTDKEMQLLPEISSEKTVHKVSGQWKPQPSRRFARGQPGNRFAEKHHGSDNVVWAPVQTQTKAAKSSSSSVEAKPKFVEENSTKVDDNGAAAQNASKGKRAEMERYVPKPVALEMSQPQIHKEEEQDPDAKAIIKHKKDNGTWRRRGPSDSSQNRSTKPANNPSEGQENREEVAKDPNPSSDENDATSGKNNTSVNRGKRHIVRVPGGGGGGEFDGPPDTEKVNFKSRERATHWQPKNQLNFAASHNHQTMTAKVPPGKDHHRHMNVKWRVAHEAEAKRAAS